MTTHQIARRLLERPEVDLAAGLCTEPAIDAINHVLEGLEESAQDKAATGRFAAQMGLQTAPSGGSTIQGLLNNATSIIQGIRLATVRRTSTPAHPDHHGGTPEVHPVAAV